MKDTISRNEVDKADQELQQPLYKMTLDELFGELESDLDDIDETNSQDVNISLQGAGDLLKVIRHRINNPIY